MVTAREPDVVVALERGGAFVVLEDAAVTSVSGPDARAWLHDLVTTDVESLSPGVSRPSLLLTPTGRIRAQFQVACVGLDAFVLIEREPASIARTLALYVLSSDVEVAPTALTVVSVPGAWTPRGGAGSGVVWVRPSVLGDGTDLLASDVAEALAVLVALASGTLDDAERLRVARGIPRLGVDLDGDSLPAEAGLDAAPVTDRGKGCFLGQEAIAKVANLGHPTRLVVAVEASDPVSAGEPVVADGDEVGQVTSADGRLALVRVRWAARDAELATGAGATLSRR